MFGEEALNFANVPDDQPPLLVVIVDTEEEFDWHKPLSRENNSVQSIAAQDRAQRIFAQYGIVPTYVIDYPVASDPRAIEILAGFASSGSCEIGAHLHPWVNPPYREDVNARNSYPGNLPPDLEREKLEVLTDTIIRNLGARPTVYKAGRYGFGPATARILEELGYRVDASVVPFTEFTRDGGSDFSQFSFRPFWFGSCRELLELPLSCGFYGLLSAAGPRLYPKLTCALGMRLHLPGVFAHLGLLERIRLTPEGIDLPALMRLTNSLLCQGCRVFCFTYHSPSLEPGCTPYVRNNPELQQFLDTMERYFHFFIDVKGGQSTTVIGLYDLFKASSVPTASRAA